MTPEPRPDEPTPQAPPPKRPVSNHAILGALFLVTAITISLFLWLKITRNYKVAVLSEATSNLRSLSCNLYAFDEEYGSFPDASTAEDVQDSTGTPLTLGNSSSNQLFRQLIATVGRSEKNLFDPAQPYWRGIPPDLKWPE